ncbi:unnamed protein product [Rhizophagus irregularis]|nr:unnamed protein product [Rhizophagus irregularis]
MIIVKTPTNRRQTCSYCGELWSYLETLLRTSRESEILYETFLLPYREIKEKKEKEKEEEHWILSWRPEFLRMEIDGAMIPVATPWDGMAVSTFKTVSEVDNDFRANAHEDTTMADSIKCGVEIKRQGNHDGLVRSIGNRKQGCQKSNNKVSGESRIRESSSLSSGRSWEFELQNDHETQNTHDLASLIRLLKDKEPYRDETNKDVLFDYEIQFFAETYGITDFLLVFACGDWENLCYVDEITRKLVPINAYDKEAEELVKPPEACNNIDVTKNTLFANLYKSAVQEANLNAEMPLQ